MKISSKTERYFDITGLPESKAKIISLALYYYQAPDKDTAENVIQLRKIFDEMMKPAEQPVPPQLLTDPFDGKPVTHESLTLYVKRLAPYGKLMVPKTFAPEQVNKWIGISQFMLGTKGQLNISYWANEDDYDKGTEATSKVWFNSECVQIIYDFIKAPQYCSPKDELEWNGYVNNEGKLSNSKTMQLRLSTKKIRLSITKDDAYILLDMFDTICLREFLRYHLEVDNNG